MSAMPLRQAQNSTSDKILLGGYLAYSPSMDREHTCREGEDLVEIARVKHDSCTRIARRTQSSMHIGRRPDIEPAGWILRDNERRLPVELSRENESLLITSGQGPRRRRHVVGTDVVFEREVSGPSA